MIFLGKNLRKDLSNHQEKSQTNWQNKYIFDIFPIFTFKTNFIFLVYFRARRILEKDSMFLSL